MLRQFHPLWMNIHFNHAKELTPEVADGAGAPGRCGHPAGRPDRAAGRRQRLGRGHEGAGAQAGAQPRAAVLPVPVRPGGGRGPLPHDVSKGIEIIEGLRGHTSGYAIPTYVVDAPGGGGKIPVMPQYLISQAPGKVVLRNFEGFITTYDEPNDYTGHTVARPETACAERTRPGRRAIYGLLSGAARAHQAGGVRHAAPANRDAALPIGPGRLADVDAESGRRLPAPTATTGTDISSGSSRRRRTNG